MGGGGGKRIALVTNSLRYQGWKLTACLSRVKSNVLMVLDWWWLEGKGDR